MDLDFQGLLSQHLAIYSLKETYFSHSQFEHTKVLSKMTHILKWWLSSVSILLPLSHQQSKSNPDNSRTIHDCTVSPPTWQGGLFCLFIKRVWERNLSILVNSCPTSNSSTDWLSVEEGNNWSSLFALSTRSWGQDLLWVFGSEKKHCFTTGSLIDQNYSNLDGQPLWYMYQITSHHH